MAAALKGSSFYKLPGFLQWFSASIGFHHVHHLSPAIPNYNLEKCHREHSLFQEVKTLTLRSSLKSLSLRLWDEQGRKAHLLWETSRNPKRERRRACGPRITSARRRGVDKRRGRES